MHYGVQKMKLRFEWLYDPLRGITFLFVWRGMLITHNDEFEYEVDAFEKDGIEEELRKELG